MKKDIIDEVLSKDEEYRNLYEIVRLFATMRRCRLRDMHAGGIIHTSRNLRDRLEAFEYVVASRAKSKFDMEKCTIDHVKRDYGDGFDDVEMLGPYIEVHPIDEDEE